MELGAFTWGAGGQKATPASVKRQAAIAAALAAKSGAPQNLGEGLNRIGEALAYNGLSAKAEAGEAEGGAARKAVIDALLANPDPSMTDITGAMGNEWVADDPASSAVLQALMGQENQQQGWAREDSRLQQQRGWQIADQQAGFAHDQSLLDQKANSPVVINDQLVKPGDQPEVLGDYRTPPKAPEPTALIQNLTAAGLRPGTKEFNDAVLAGTKTGVTVNTGDNGGAFTKKADELAASRLGDIVTSGQGASQLMGDIKTLAALGTQVDTGLGAQVMSQLGPFAQAVGINIEGLPEGQAYQAIIDRMAPNMRPVGSGSSSDTDVRMFLNSLAGLGKTPKGNEIILGTLTALQQHKLAAAEIAGLSFTPPDQGGITWQEAEKRIRELPDPYEGFNAYKQELGGGETPAATGTPNKVVDAADYFKP